MEKTSEVMENILIILMAGSLTFAGILLVLIIFDAFGKKK